MLISALANSLENQSRVRDSRTSENGRIRNHFPIRDFATIDGLDA